MANNNKAHNALLKVAMSAIASFVNYRNTYATYKVNVATEQTEDGDIRRIEVTSQEGSGATDAIYATDIIVLAKAFDCVGCYLDTDYGKVRVVVYATYLNEEEE